MSHYNSPRSPCSAKNIYNADETCLFWRACNDQTLVLHGEKVHGLKSEK